MSAIYKKLKNGNWGVKIEGHQPPVGSYVEVRKANGEIKRERIEKILWGDIQKQIYICAIYPNSGSRPRKEM